MPRANLTVTIPDGIWIGDVTRAHPDATVRILSALTGDEAGVGLAEITAPDLQDVVSDIQDSDSVVELEILQQYQDTVLVQFETTMPLLLFPVQDSGVPLTMPFTIQDGQAEWELTAPQHRLSELGTQLDEFGIPFTVNEIRQHIEPEQLLTERQLRLVSAAVERGYYDTPRECSLTDLAETLELAKSTCSETLHRAEEKIVKQFLEDLDGTTIESPHP
ncbi:DNA-binding protein [Halogeometricum borinquense DSM 11551]|uniref:DNA-binding protein n=2 Tax=Halogeometricum borinquense TaxID=60847 RepID=E4NUW5_HALBP|nr:helix-turn-helix domain-containing protein [Halogeometricum borinquense]ADQ68954.1 predicted DNA binding protein [Halogeometricum borinquense DSM 11551]ELY29122.1 DNA-binding protein [Halogeometricum borinquense DSM 11551]RYJ08145.1 helix-turn-helix domain-containing protein [Halogeometricum borinquense]